MVKNRKMSCKGGGVNKSMNYDTKGKLKKLPIVIVVDVIGIPTKPGYVVVDAGLWGSQIVQNSCAVCR